MTQGKVKTNYLHREGIVRSANRPDYGFIYEISKIKAPKWNVGDIVKVGNGKEFVYCKSGGACYTGLGNILYNAIDAIGIDYSNNVAEGRAIGDKSVLVTEQGVNDIAEDELRGGTILFKTATGSDDTALQCRGIIGNTPCSSGGTTRIYLDAPLTGVLTTASYSYCMPSPYSDVRYEGSGNGQHMSHVGFAATYVSAANTYHWEQFKGRIMGTSMHGNEGKNDNERELVWRYQGSLQIRGTTEINGLRQQVAGYIMDNNVSQNGATEVMLTGHV